MSNLYVPTPSLPVKSITAHNPAQCVILVPYMNRIEHATDTALRVLESRGYEVWRTPGYSAIDQARNRMAYDALYRRFFQELMWIDADVGFDPDDFERLRQHGLGICAAAGLGICAAAYPFKGFPRFTIETFNDDPLVFGEGGKLVRVKSVATGFLYTQRGVYERLRLHFGLPLCNTSFDAPMYPFFRPQIFMEQGNWYYLGEDFSFCRLAQQAGMDIWLDTRIRLQHIGNYAWQWEDVIRPPQPEKLASISYDPAQAPAGWSGYLCWSGQTGSLPTGTPVRSRPS